MTRQYIGARYMPKFCGEYDNTTAYEALSVVDNGSGTTYVCSKPTPPNTPLTDRDYWQPYGSSSGAILDLQNQIDTIRDTTIPSLESSLEKDISKTVCGYAGDDIKNKHIILMGDSYLRGTVCTGLNPDTYSHNIEDGWGYKVTQLLDMDSDHIEAIGIGGASFALSGGTHWQDTIQSYVSTQDPDDINMIVLIGGANDRYENRDDILSGISSFFTNARAKYPNATICIGFCGNKLTSESIQGLKTAFMAYHDGCIMNHGVFLADLENIMQDASLLSLDDLHPTAGGYTQLARQIANVIRGGGVDYYHSYALTLTSKLANATITASAIAGISNNVHTIQIDDLRFDVTGAPNMRFGPSDVHLIADMGKSPIVGFTSHPCTAIAIGYITSSDDPISGPFLLTIKENKLYLQGFYYNPSVPGWNNIHGVTTIRLVNIRFIDSTFSIL